MMNMKFELYTDDDGVSGVKLDDAHYVGWDLEGWCPDCHAYMNLIAAAPDLLMACKAFVDAYEKSLQLEKTDVALRIAKAAIEKAETGQ